MGMEKKCSKCGIKGTWLNSYKRKGHGGSYLSVGDMLDSVWEMGGKGVQVNGRVLMQLRDDLWREGGYRIW